MVNLWGLLEGKKGEKIQSEGHLLLKYLQAAQRPEIILKIQIEYILFDKIKILEESKREEDLDEDSPNLLCIYTFYGEIWRVVFLIDNR